MANRVVFSALLAIGLIGPTTSEAAWRGPNFIPWEQAAKIAKETGKPVAVYSVVDSNGGKKPEISTVNADWSVNECVKLKEAKEFVWTRCDGVKVARLVKVKGEPPQMYFFDCDMEPLSSCGVSDLDSVESALQGALEHYSNREIAWDDYSEDAVKGSTDRKFVLVAFTTERDECTVTMKNLEDRTMVKHQPKVRFLKTAYVKDSEEARKWGVASAPMWLIIDPNSNNKVIERIQGKRTVNELRAFIAKGLKETAGKKPGSSSP